MAGIADWAGAAADKCVRRQIMVIIGPISLLARHSRSILFDIGTPKDEWTKFPLRSHGNKVRVLYAWSNSRSPTSPASAHASMSMV